MALELFGDFGVAAGFDATANPYQDAQVCINWMPEVSPSKEAKQAVSLLGSPGLVQLGAINSSSSTWTADSAAVTADSSAFTADGGGSGGAPIAWPTPSSVTTLPVRACWVLPGWTQALVVIGNTVYLATVGAYGNQVTPGVINLASVGEIATSSGPVSIRDNGTQGGYAVLVDGSSASYLYQISTQKLTVGPFPGANTVAYIDGWWVFNQSGSPIFYTDAQPYSQAYNASYFALADSSSDILMGLIENKEELWLVKERTAEIWYDAGGAYFPFQRLVGTPLQVGCKAAYSIARLVTLDGRESLMWLGRSERGENFIVRTRGFSFEIVSTPAIANALAQYTTTSDAFAYTYEEGGHAFYVITFPTADATWVYDATLPPSLAWHQRLSFDPYANAYHRHRSNCFMNFAGMRIVGDYQNGALYQMTRAAYTDAGWPIKAKRRTPFVWDRESRERVFLSSLQLDFAPGQGNASGAGANPQAKLRISRDYGSTYGSAHYAPMGQMGQFLNRCIFRKLGFSRGAVLELEVIDPVNRDLVGATLKAFAP